MVERGLLDGGKGDLCQTLLLVLAMQAPLVTKWNVHKIRDATSCVCACMPISIHTYIYIYIYTHIHIERERDRARERERERDRRIQRERERESDRARERQIQRETEKERAKQAGSLPIKHAHLITIISGNGQNVL